MKKDAFYFPHFCNARHDRKIKRLRKELGLEGYGIFFMLLEVLREQTDFKYPCGDLDLLADEFGTSEQKLNCVISNYQLFEVDNQKNLFSPKFIFHLMPYIEKSKRARDANKIRWDKYREENPNGIQMDSKSNPDKSPSKAKQSKVKQSKVKQSKVIALQIDVSNEIIIDLNNILNTKYMPGNKKTKDLIQSRMNEGYEVKDFKIVHRKMAKKWGPDNKMRQYLRPITLYSPKFESYLNMPDDLKMSEKAAKTMQTAEEWLRKKEVEEIEQSSIH